MNKRHIGLLLKSILNEKNISVTRVSELTGRSRQQIHNDFNRVTIKDEVLEIYAEALKMEKQAIYDRLDEQDSPGAANNEYLQDYLKNLEEQFKRLMDQLQTKDQQIENLHEMLKMALGKSDPTPGNQSKVRPLYTEDLPVHMYHYK